MKNISSEQKSYLAGFLDGDGSIYVRLKPNITYKFGLMRIRKDGILEYTISRQEEIIEFLLQIKNYLVMKKPQAELVLEVMKLRKDIQTQKDFNVLMNKIDQFRELNYSKKRKIYEPVETTC